MQNYMEKISPEEMCSALQLCSVRKRDNQYLVAVKKIDGTIYEIPLEDMAQADEYEWLPIVRTYSSWHGFFSPDLSNIFLVTTQKDEKKPQVQFTGGSPLEENNQQVTARNAQWEIVFNLAKIEENALIRTKNRVGVDVLENMFELPLVDWVLMENKTEEEHYYRLVALFHYVVKSYNGVLTPIIGSEWVIWWQRYNVDDVLTRKIEWLAPNADVIVKKALEMIK